MDFKDHFNYFVSFILASYSNLKLIEKIGKQKELFARRKYSLISKNDPNQERQCETPINTYTKIFCQQNYYLIQSSTAFLEKMDNLLPQFEPHKRKIPEFIIKLYHILENKDYSDIICWTSQGNEILIKSPKKLQDKVLPHFFRHKHLSSFVRQLNMYGFSKANKVMKEKNHTYFRNELFKKNQVYLLTKIRRKNNKKKGDRTNGQNGQIFSENSETSHHHSQDSHQKKSYEKTVKNSVNVIENQIKAALLLIQSYTNENKKKQRTRRKQPQQQSKTKAQSLEQHIEIKEKLMRVLQQCQQIKQVKQALDNEKIIKKPKQTPQLKVEDDENQNSFVVQPQQNGTYVFQDPHRPYACRDQTRQLFSIKSLRDFFPRFDSINCFTSQCNIMDRIEPNNNNGFQYE